jgi:hypothetical protein
MDDFEQDSAMDHVLYEYHKLCKLHTGKIESFSDLGKVTKLKIVCGILYATFETEESITTRHIGYFMNGNIMDLLK